MPLSPTEPLLPQVRAGLVVEEEGTADPVVAAITGPVVIAGHPAANEGKEPLINAMAYRGIVTGGVPHPAINGIVSLSDRYQPLSVMERSVKGSESNRWSNRTWKRKEKFPFSRNSRLSIPGKSRR